MHSDVQSALPCRCFVICVGQVAFRPISRYAMRVIGDFALILLSLDRSMCSLMHAKQYSSPM